MIAGVRSLAFLLVIALATSRSALAHHGTATARVAASPPTLDTSFTDGPASSPRLSATVRHDTSYFGHTMRGSQEDSRAPLGSVLRHETALTLGLELATQTALRATLPYALVRLTPEGESSHSVSGIGDLSLFVSHRLPISLTALPDLHLSIAGSLAAPTGDYQQSAGLELVEVSTQNEGIVEVVTFYSQASVGAGAWAAAATAHLSWLPLPNLRVQVGGGSVLPLSDTLDSVRWGVDTHAGGVARLDLWQRALGLSAGVNYLRHGKDRVVNEFGSQRVGGRSEVAVELGLQTWLSPMARCGAGTRIPLWRRASGVQLMGTVAGSLNCTLVTSL